VNKRNELQKPQFWNVALYTAETWTLSKARKKTVGSIWNVDVAEDAANELDREGDKRRGANEYVPIRANEATCRSILKTIWYRKHRWLGHVFSRGRPIFGFGFGFGAECGEFLTVGWYSASVECVFKLSAWLLDSAFFSSETESRAKSRVESCECDWLFRRRLTGSTRQSQYAASYYRSNNNARIWTPVVCVSGWTLRAEDDWYLRLLEQQPISTT